MYDAKQYLETTEYARRALEIDANFYFIRFTMGLAQRHAGFTQELITSLKRRVELAPWLRMGVGSLAAAYWAAVYYAAAGEVDAMFEALDGAYRQRETYLPFLRYEALFDPYRADPRFQALLQRMNLA